MAKECSRQGSKRTAETAANSEQKFDLALRTINFSITDVKNKISGALGGIIVGILPI